jgi:hypothetical protein
LSSAIERKNIYGAVVLICKYKSKGGHRVKNLKLINSSLSCKWWWKLEFENGIWQSIVKAKYGLHHGIWRVKHRQDDSAAWSDLLKIKHLKVE